MSKQCKRRPTGAVNNPGYARISDLARRWKVSRDRIPTIARSLQLHESIHSVRPRYSWRSIWAVEGAGQPGHKRWDIAKRKVFLTPREVADALRLKDRTIRERMETGGLPFLKLGPRIRRIDPAVLEQVQSGV